MSWSLNDDMDEALNSPVSAVGHVNPKEENRDTTCRKSTPMPRADRFTPSRRAVTSRPTTTTGHAKHTHTCTRHRQHTTFHEHLKIIHARLWQGTTRLPCDSSLPINQRTKCHDEPSDGAVGCLGTGRTGVTQTVVPRSNAVPAGHTSVPGYTPLRGHIDPRQQWGCVCCHLGPGLRHSNDHAHMRGVTSDHSLRKLTLAQAPSVRETGNPSRHLVTLHCRTEALTEVDVSCRVRLVYMPYRDATTSKLHTTRQQSHTREVRSDMSCVVTEYRRVGDPQGAHTKHTHART
jgi:hypothetical protein